MRIVIYIKLIFEYVSPLLLYTASFKVCFVSMRVVYPKTVSVPYGLDFKKAFDSLYSGFFFASFFLSLKFVLNFFAFCGLISAFFR